MYLHASLTYEGQIKVGAMLCEGGEKDSDDEVAGGRAAGNGVWGGRGEGEGEGEGGRWLKEWREGQPAARGEGEGERAAISSTWGREAAGARERGIKECD